MNKLHQHLQQESKKFRMTDAEKSAMRAHLSEAMGGNSSAMPTRSPYVYGWLFAPRSVAVFALAFLVLISTGTTYAAEGSLPGGVLYPVKTGVLEPLAVALATTPAAKAEVNANIATKRVAEAQILAAQGTLTVETAQEISDNYHAHATAALALAAHVDAEDTGSVEGEGSATATSSVVSSPDVALKTTHDKDADVPDLARTSKTAGNAEATVDDGAEDGEGDTQVHTLSTTLSIRAVSAPTAAPAPATTTARTMEAPKATVPAVTASTTPSSTSGLSGKLNATFSAQAKILEKLQAEARSHETDGQEVTSGSSESDGRKSR